MGCGASNEVRPIGDISKKELTVLEKQSKLPPDLFNVYRARYQALGSKLTGEDFVQFYSNHKSANNEELEDFLRQIFHIYDEDQSGYMDFEEFIMMMASIVKGTRINRLTLIFKLCDDNTNSGYIELAELLKTIQSLKFIIRENHFHNALKLVEEVSRDLDSDGNKRMSLSEFLEEFDKHEHCERMIAMIFNGIVDVLSFGEKC